MENPSDGKRIQRVRHEIKRRDVEVGAVRLLAPDYLSVTFHGDSLEDFVSASYDDHIKFIFSNAAGEQLMRDYTPRAYDRAARTLTIEFALHGDEAGHDGAPQSASDWARLAAPGQRATIAGPRGSMIIPTDYAWQVLAGDATAFPAIRRRLDELPASARVTVLALGAAAGALSFAGAAQVTLHVVHDAEALLSALRALPFDGDGFVWCGAEAALAKQVRDVVFGEKNHPRDAARISAYWKQGAEAHHENLE